MPVTLGSVAKPTETWTCDSPYIKLNELSPIAGNTEGSFEVEYRPLKPTEQPLEHLLTIITKELGTFKYKVVVKATPPMLRQTLRFDVPLGSMQTDYFVFKAYNTTKCDYTCSSTKPDFFIVQKTLTVEPVSSWEGEDIRLPVMFEPGVIGEVKDTLKLTSSEGEYVCELVGTCSPPLPQGPFDFLQGSGAKDIPFRNCFTANCNWTFSIDSTAFRVGAPTATVNAKTEGKCTVFFEPKDEHMAAPGSVVTAKLFITCSSIPNIPPWVFYLKGKVDPNAGASGGKSKGKK